ncbi:glycosyltransferase family 4 protein [Maribacter sp. IgM3_T14_3]|uniref:glycosyltransferase family 4 protein n=1 Tax=Maribacter sp. IgM3_T14_3 TaxID=3415140 RepID=UPI003C6F5411
MNNKKIKVLVIATSRLTRGGITSVIKAHENSPQWKESNCKWIETHRDGSNFQKIWYLLTALITFFFLLPFYNIVHIHIATSSSAKRKQLFIYPTKWLKKKLIMHFHPSNEKFLFEIKNQKLYKRLFAKADLILVLSQQWKRWLQEALEIHDRVDVLYNPCPSVNQNRNLHRENILVAGSIIPRKGYKTIINAFSLIAADNPKWKLVFAGNGEIDIAKNLVKTKGIDQQVEFLGWVKDSEKEMAFQKASIYCLASDGEGFPMGLLDAWAYHLPSIVTPVGGIPDIVEHGVNGMIYPVGDFKTLSTQLNHLINDAEIRKRIINETDKLVTTIFNVDHINNQLALIYKNLLKN